MGRFSAEFPELPMHFRTFSVLAVYGRGSKRLGNVIRLLPRAMAFSGSPGVRPCPSLKLFLTLTGHLLLLGCTKRHNQMPGPCLRPQSICDDFLASPLLYPIQHGITGKSYIPRVNPSFLVNSIAQM